MNLTAAQTESTLYPRPVRFYAQIGSTNDVALEWLCEGAPSGSVVAADEQVKGRGRLGRSWYAPPGTALMMSVVLRPPQTALARVSMLGAVVVCELLESLGLHDIGIKWPNDVRLQNKKVCGVLPEAIWDGNRLIGVTLGIGLNVRIDFTGTPFADSAISIETVLGEPVDRLDLLKTVLQRVDYWSKQWSSRAVFDAWKARLATLGQNVSIGEVHGVAQNVDEQGALLVRDNSGTIHRIIAGDIALGDEG